MDSSDWYPLSFASVAAQVGVLLLLVVVVVVVVVLLLLVVVLLVVVPAQRCICRCPGWGAIVIGGGGGGGGGWLTGSKPNATDYIAPCITYNI